MDNRQFSKLCTPAKIYFAIAVLSSIFALFKGVTILAVFLKLLFAFIWTYILALLCKKGYKSVSWFLVLLPLIVFFLSIAVLLSYQTYRDTVINVPKIPTISLN